MSLCLVEKFQLLDPLIVRSPQSMSTPRMTPRASNSTSFRDAQAHSEFYVPGQRLSSSTETQNEEGTQSAAMPVQTVEQPMRHRLLRVELLVIASIACFGYLAWRTIGQERAFQETLSKQNQTSRLLSDAISHQAKMVAEVGQSIQQTTKVLGDQIGGLSGQLQARQTQIDTLESRVRGVEKSFRYHQMAQVNQAQIPQAQIPQAQVPQAQVPQAQVPQAQVPQVKVTQPQANEAQQVQPAAAQEAVPSSQAASPQHPHIHQFDTSIPMPPGTVTHRSLGLVDYWLVPRLFSSGERMVKVQPYGTNSLGVKVHSLEDGLDYILTPSGQWTAALN